MKKKKNGGFLDWLVRKFRPGHHIAKNPAKGVKRKKKIRPFPSATLGEAGG